jgi:hypothetical protein
MYKIALPENSSSNCFDSVVYSLLKYYGLDYEAYNIKYFYTDYLSPSDNILYSICRGKSYRNILRDIYGIDLVFEDKNESDGIFEAICKSLNSNPICITIDPYHCHWSPFSFYVWWPTPDTKCLLLRCVL